MMHNSLIDIIERCHQRHKKTLRQRKSVATHWIYNKNFPHQYKIYCAHKYPVVLADLEQANICFTPIGRALKFDGGLDTSSYKWRLPNRQGLKNIETRHWIGSWGIQVYTGILSECNGAPWHDLDFKYEAICNAPDAVIACIEALVNAVDNPLLTLSKSGGLRFSCRIPEYLHSHTDEIRLYIFKETATVNNIYQRDVFLEILGEDCFSYWDARYEILIGNLLDPPIIDKDILFAHIDTLRDVIHAPAASKEKHVKSTQQTSNVIYHSLGSSNLDLAKDTLVKHGFSYTGEDGGYHYWTQGTATVDSRHVSLWEQDGTVWVRALTPDVGLPMEATPITDVWDSKDILLVPDAGALPISDKVLAVREGTLSPLGIKRPPPILRKHKQTHQAYETHEKNVDKIRDVFDKHTRILGLIAETGTGKNFEAESYVIRGGTICLNVPSTRLAIEAEQRFKKRNVPSTAIWKPRMYRWDQVKNIPIHVRMENPFEHGNVCEDPERCNALRLKGGNPSESICPECPVYTRCQQHGFLSQAATLRNSMAQIFSMPELFFNPQYAELLKYTLEHVDGIDRICITDKAQAHRLFPECKISKDVLEEWNANWQGNTLGNFAKALLNALNTAGNTQSSIVKRIRATVNLFQQQEEELINQMCQVNVQGKVVEHGIVDSETGKALAHYTIQFERGLSAYIPINNTAADKLSIMGMPFLKLNFSVLNEDMKIPMEMAQAIKLGILDIGSVSNIWSFPTVCPNPNWTLWHQLKSFLAHYKRDVDAPIAWYDEVLHFWVPPMLDPRIKRLLIMSSKLDGKQFLRAFPDADVIHIKPGAWLSGNHVFQIRTGNYPLYTILKHDNNWHSMKLAILGMRFLFGIRSEIEKDPNIKHAIITHKFLAEQLTNIAQKDNVCFVTNFLEINGLDEGFKEAQVLWIIGTPYWPAGAVWLRSQIVFGNDEEPLCYDGDQGTCIYKDKRVQSICDQYIISLLTDAIVRAGLSHLTGKTIVLISSVELPDITNRPETILFDWEDFEVAGGLDRLPEVIKTREYFEAERDKLTAQSSREEVEHVLGCSPRQANRVLQRLRGGIPLRVPLRKQILSALANGEKKTAELVSEIDGYPTSIKKELRRLIDTGEIIRIRRGVYVLAGDK